MKYHKQFFNCLFFLSTFAFLTLNPLPSWTQEEQETTEEEITEQETTQEIDQEFEDEIDEPAKTTQTTINQKDEDVDQVVITSNRYKQKSRELPTAHTIITREDIQKSGKHKNVLSILANQPGIDMRTYSSAGWLTSIFIRGIESGGTLFLLNGFPASSLQLQNIPVDSIEQIEILRGNQTALYGDKAFGGVINVITRKDPISKTKETKIMAHTYLGSHAMHDLGIGISTSGPDYSFFAYTKYFDTKGYIKPRNGIKTRSIAFSGSMRPSPLSEIFVSGNFMDNMIQSHSGPLKPSKTDQRGRQNSSSLVLGYSHLFFDFWEPKTTFEYNEGSSYGSPSDGFGFNFQNNLYLFDSLNITSLGFEYQYKETSRTSGKISERSTTTAAKKKTIPEAIQAVRASRINTAQSNNRKIIYLSNIFKLVPGLTFTAAANYEFFGRNNGEDTKDFRGATVKNSDQGLRWNAGLAYRIIDQSKAPISLVKIRTNGGGGKIFSKAQSQSGDNLKPPYNLGFDAGLDLEIYDSFLKIGGTFFYNKTQDMISWIPLDRTKFGYDSGSHANVGNYNATGFEIELASSMPFGFSLDGAFTYTNLKKDLSSGSELNFARELTAKEKEILKTYKTRESLINISRRSKNKFRANLTWDGTKPFNFPMRVSINWIYVGERKTQDWSSVIRGTTKKNPNYLKFINVPGYGVLDVGASYTLFDTLTLLFQVNNLLDKQYEPILDYPADKINFYGGFKLNWKI